MELLIIITFIVISAYIDYEHLKDNDYIESHVSRGLLRALFILVASNTLTDVIGMTLVFMALFDGVLNKLTKVSIFYLGTTALWDRFWGKIPHLFIMMKVVSLFVGVYLCLI